jgi:hypothetical protein
MFRSKSSLSSRVFLVYGRNRTAHTLLSDLLQQFGLSVLDWEGAVALTGKASPHAREVIAAALDHVGAVVVLMTGDEDARLRSEFCAPHELRTEGELNSQSRPNVIFEAGMAFGLFPTRTIVVQLGRLRIISDIAGVQYVPLDESAESRRALANRLRTAGCAIDEKASRPLALPHSETGLPAVSAAGANGGRLTVFRRLKSFLPLPGLGGSLEVAQAATAGEPLTLTLDLHSGTESYRVLHWLPGAATPIEIARGTDAAEALNIPLMIGGPAGIHVFDLQTRTKDSDFALVARKRCAVGEKS